jgi:chitodextrinase
MLPHLTVMRFPLTVIRISLIVVMLGFFSGMCFISSAAPTQVRINPLSQTVNASTSFSVTVNCVPEEPVKAFELKLSFNPSLVQVISVSEGDIFGGYTTFFSPGVIDNSGGTIVNIYNLIVGPGNITSAGSLVVINCTARSTSGTSPLSLYDVRLTNETGYIDISVSSGSVTVTGGSNPPSPPSEPPSEPDNTPPSVPFRPLGPLFVEINTSYSYSSAAVDVDGDLVRLRFDWGDGTLSVWSDFVASNTTVSAFHEWTNISTYEIRVIAQDFSGENSSWSEALNVTISQNEPEGIPPVGSFLLPVNATANQTAVFDASASYDPDGSIISYFWDFGDGSTGQEAIVGHTYQNPGWYTVILTVTDNSGLTANSSQVLSVASVTGASTGGDFGFLSLFPPLDVLLLIIVVIMIAVGALLYSRYRPQKVLVSKHVERSTQNPAPISTSMADINQIVDGLFMEVKSRRQVLKTDSILDAYNTLIVRRMEQNPGSTIPNVSMNQVEELVNRRIHALIAEKIDQL